MKDKGFIYTVFSIFVVLALITSTFGAASISINLEGAEKQNTLINLHKISTSSFKTSKSCIISSNNYGDNVNINNFEESSYNNSENFIVSNMTGNESYPSVVSRGLKSLIAYEYEEDGESHIYLQNSYDYGRNWSSSRRIEVDIEDSYLDVETLSPSLCAKQNTNKAYGAFLSPHNNSGVYGYMEVGDIGNINSISAGAVDWSYWKNESSGEEFNWFDFSNPSIIPQNIANTPWIIGLTGSTTYSEQGVEPVDDSIMFGWRDYRDPDVYWIQWDPEVGNCSNLSIATSTNLETIYGVCEIKNESEERTEILFIKGNYETDEDGDPFINTTYKIIQSVASLTNPEIFIKGNNIYFSVEIHIKSPIQIDDIEIYHSANGGASWTSYDPTGSVMAPPGEFVPSNPTIFVNDTHIVCNYVEDNDLYYTTSDTPSQNWTDPIQINDVNGSVVEQYRFIDTPDENHVVWTDNREGDYDIYTSVKGYPEFDLRIDPASVKLSTEGLKIFETKNRIELSVENVGANRLENIDVIFKIEYNESLNKTARETDYPISIPYLNSGQSNSFDRTLFRISVMEFIKAIIFFAGVEYINITIDPNNTYNDIDRSDNNYKLPVTYKEIFPNLADLEDIILKIPIPI